MFSKVYFLCILVFSFSSYSVLANNSCESAFMTKQGTKVKVTYQKTFPLDHPEALRHFFDHTLLKPQASYKDIIKLVEEAISYKLKAVCINACRVKEVAVYLDKKEGTYKPLIATVIGFPLGAVSKDVKVQEAKKAVADGANELDMVINVGYVKDKKWDLVKSEIEHVVQEAKVPVKVIIETDLLTDNEILTASKVSALAGARFVKTSTGFVPNGKGALFKNINIMQQGIKYAQQDRIVEIKASGGVKTLIQTVEFLKKESVARLGSSSSLDIMKIAMKRYKVDISELGK